MVLAILCSHRRQPVFASAAMAGFRPRDSASRMMLEAVMLYRSAASFMAWCISAVRETVVCEGNLLPRRRPVVLIVARLSWFIRG